MLGKALIFVAIPFVLTTLFSRMLGVRSTANDMYIKQFCIEWSYWDVQAPLQGLDEVDQYMYYEYKNWRGR